MAKLITWLMPLLALLPLFALRSIGWLVGRICYRLIPSRRRITLINLGLCFPNWSEQQCEQVAKSVFVKYVQSVLDRSWLWHAPKWVVKKRLVCTGDWTQLQGDEPTIIFIPHFFGLDAAATAATLNNPDRLFYTIYIEQSNPVITNWMIKGRTRFGQVAQFPKGSGVRDIVSKLRKGGVLGILSDMNFDPRESVFVPFFGQQACTTSSLSRFAKLGRAKVISLIAKMTPNGYEIEMTQAWPDFPTHDVVQDTACMNQHLEHYVTSMPDQYFWVHKRFKNAPEGVAPPY